MKPEKYYGIINPGETTKKDDSSIDCEYPGPTNPSTSGTLNTSSILDNIGTIGTLKSYIKIADCPLTFTISNHNDAIIDSSLYVHKNTLLDNTIKYTYSLFDNMSILGTEEQVYIGYEDTDKIFKGNVTSVITTLGTLLDSDTADCSAIAKYIKNDNTGMPIKYSLNKCTADRTITFSYKNTPIFKIKLTYTETHTYDTIYIWKITPGSTVSDSLAFFEDDNDLPSLFNNSGSAMQFLVWSGMNLSATTALVYYSTSKFAIDSTVSSLKNSGKLTHVQGHDYLNDSTNYDDLYLDKLSVVNTYNANATNKYGTTNVTLSMKIIIYKRQASGVFTTAGTMLFNDTSNSNHMGVYKYLRS